MDAKAGKQPYSLAAFARLVRGNANFRRLWCAQIISEIGDWLYVVAVYSLLLEYTGQASSVGTAVVLQLLPQVLIAPVAGVINDRLSRKSVMIFADLARMVIVLGMLLVSAERVWLVWLLLFLETIMWAVFEPGRSAVVPVLCPEEDERLVANALSSTTWAVNFAIGAGIGGLLTYQFGREALFVMNGLSFVLSAWFLARMKFAEPHTNADRRLGWRELLPFQEIRDGFQYVWSDPRLKATLGVKAGMGLLGAHWVLLPLYGERVFQVGSGAHAGALGMSVLLMSRGIGALCGSLFSGAWAQNHQERLRGGILWGFVLAALSYFGLGLAPSLLLACAAVVVGHAGTSTCWVFSTSMLQNMTEDKYRGRVFSADFAGLTLMMTVVSVAAAYLIDAGVAVRHIAVGTGVLGILPVLFWLVAMRRWVRPAMGGPATPDPHRLP